MPPSPDPQAKVDRAYEHIDALAERVRVFALDAYSVDAYPGFWKEPVGVVGNAVIIEAEATASPPSVEWGPIIGDIVHCLRSALDQLIWSLSIDFQTAPPPPDPIPRGDPWRDIWFPVSLKPTAWPNAVRQQLWAIDPALHAPLKALQPFATRQNAADREALAVLQELWSIDKHRHLHLVNATVELHDVLSVKPFPDAPDLDFEVISKRAPGPLVGRTEVGRARHIRRPGGLIAVNLPQVHMNPRLAVDVAFDQGPPAHGGRVLQTLSHITETVRDIIDAF